MCDYHIFTDPRIYKISIIVMQVNPSTKESYPISSELIFNFNVNDPINIDVLYDSIEWKESAFVHGNDIIILFRKL